MRTDINVLVAELRELGYQLPLRGRDEREGGREAGGGEEGRVMAVEEEQEFLEIVRIEVRQEFRPNLT